MTKRTVEDVARALASAHQTEDPDTKEVYLSTAPDEVRLVEVSGSVDTGGEVLPFRFAAQPASGVPYPSSVILLSLDEWRKLKKGELELPAGWGAVKALKKIA